MFFCFRVLFIEGAADIHLAGEPHGGIIQYQHKHMSCVLWKKKHDVTERGSFRDAALEGSCFLTVPCLCLRKRGNTQGTFSWCAGIQGAGWALLRQPCSSWREGSPGKVHPGVSILAKQKSSYTKITVSSFSTSQYCAVTEITDFGARPPWFADQFCHLPAEGPWLSDRTSTALVWSSF